MQEEFAADGTAVEGTFGYFAHHYYRRWQGRRGKVRLRQLRLATAIDSKGQVILLDMDNKACALRMLLGI